jgi:hypothetical protein
VEESLRKEKKGEDDNKYDDDEDDEMADFIIDNVMEDEEL